MFASDDYYFIGDLRSRNIDVIITSYEEVSPLAVVRTQAASSFSVVPGRGANSLI